MWWTIYETITGILRGHTSIEPTGLPGTLTVISHAQRMDQANRWNAVLRAWEPIPAAVVSDRLQDAVAHPYLSNVWARLTAAQRTQLRKFLVWSLGSRRYRQPTEEVSLDIGSGWPTDPAQAVE